MPYLYEEIVYHFLKLYKLNPFKVLRASILLTTQDYLLNFALSSGKLRLRNFTYTLITVVSKVTNIGITRQLIKNAVPFLALTVESESFDSGTPESVLSKLSR